MKAHALLVAMLLVLAGVASAADGNPLQDFCVALPASDITINNFLCKPATAVQSSDFASPLLRKLGNFTCNLGSAVSIAAANTFGALNTQGLSIASIDFKPKGINPPHVHPHATEVLFLAEGTLLEGFVTTAPDKKFFSKTIHADDLFVFPRGLIHFQFNPDKSKNDIAIGALNSQNPGALQVAVDLFAANPPLPPEVLEATLGIGDDELRHLIASVQDTLV